MTPEQLARIAAIASREQQDAARNRESMPATAAVVANHRRLFGSVPYLTMTEAGRTITAGTPLPDRRDGSHVPRIPGVR